MDFRIAQANDTSAVKELWAYSFESYEPYYSWYFDNIYQPDQTLCCFDGNILAASLQLAPYKMMLRGKPVTVCYIVGVITAAPYRSQGVAAKLMKFAYDHLRQKGIALSILLPASPEFYRKTSFAYIYEEHRFDIALKDLSLIAVPFGRWQRGSIDSIDFLDLVYRQMTAGKNGYIIRTKQNWHNYLQEHVGDGGKIALLQSNAGQAAGYLLYTLKDKYFHINELGYFSPQAQKSAFHFALGHQNEAQRFSWSAPIDDCAYLQLPQQDGISARPFVMGRIIDPIMALKSISYPTHARGSLILEIQDQQIADNNLKLLIKVADQAMCIENLEKSTPAHVTIDISALTTLLWGRLSVKQLVEQMGSVSGFEIPLKFLSTLFPRCDNWINEHS
ncbi:MAG: GNAT family N-acetyltransferase [Bacillota bacterium]|jgi:predicted acetyltransferase